MFALFALTVRAVIATSNPAAARSTAHAAPIPRLAPVIKATFLLIMDSLADGVDPHERAIAPDGYVYDYSTGCRRDRRVA
jgi:hypothetical protein